MIPYARQSIEESDLQAVKEVLCSDWLTQGPKIVEFEKALGALCGGSQVAVVSSATAALHLGCMAFDIKKGDRVWTSPISFVASANCAVHLGAVLDFVDVESETANISVSALKKKLIAAKRERTLPKLLIPVHFSGTPCPMAEIRELSHEYGFQVMEDASHAVGARYRNEPVGNCQFSDATVFSFHAVKIITTGEGGAFLSQKPELQKKVERLRTHGITRELSELEKENPEGWYYEQLDLGLNYRMTDIQAALGISQLTRLNAFVQRRREIASQYRRGLAGLPLRCLEENPEGESSYHLFVIRLNLEKISKSHREVFEALRALGIGVNLHYIPIPWQPYYRSLGFRQGNWPEAEKFYSEAISLPMYPGLTNAQVNQVIETVTGIVE